MSKNILVIDDDQAVRRAFELALEDSGYSVDTAQSGEEGLERFGAGGYALIFLDLKMPGINGVETLERIRETDVDVPVYIVTAFHEEFLGELRAAAARGIAFEVVRKPVGGEDIRTIVKGALDGAASY